MICKADPVSREETVEKGRRSDVTGVSTRLQNRPNHSGFRRKFPSPVVGQKGFPSAFVPQTLTSRPSSAARAALA